MENGDELRSWKDEFQEYFFLVLQALTYLSNISLEVADALVKIAIKCFDDRKEVFDEALMMMQTLCYKLESQFDQFVTHIGPYLFHSLKDTKTLKQASSTITSICTYVQSKQILEGFKDYTPVLFNHLSNSSLEIEVFEQVLGTLVETYGIVQGEFSPYFDQLRSAIQLQMQKSVEIMDKLDKEEMLNSKKIHNSIIESLVSISFTLQDYES